MSQKNEALFRWFPDSKRGGEGMRYSDMMALLKKAGENLEIEQKNVGTHSLRRGGAQAYLLAGATLQQVQFWGRWKSDTSMRLYVEGTVGATLRGLAARVIRGEEDPTLLRLEAPRPRDMQIFRAKKRLEKTFAGNSGFGMD
jgi:hypothetical protein